MYSTYYVFASCFNRIMHFGHQQGHFSCCCGVRPPGKPIKSLTGKDESVNPHKSTHQSLYKGTRSGTSPHLKPPPSCCLGYFCKHFRGFREFKSVDFNGPRRSESKVKKQMKPQPLLIYHNKSNVYDYANVVSLRRVSLVKKGVSFLL